MISRRNVLFGGLACAGCATNPPVANGAISADEYEIFKLRWSDYKCIAGDTVNFVRTDTMTIPIAFRRDEEDALAEYQRYIDFASRKHGNDVLPDTVEDFFAANRRSVAIDTAGFETACMKFVSEAEAEEFTTHQLEAEKAYREQGKRWREDALAGRLPERPPYEFFQVQLHEFSRLGFAANRSQALGFRSYFCGGLCAGLYAYLFESRDGKWEFKWEQALLNG